MRIFITGIAGFLGSHLAERLILLGHLVSGCDNLLGGELANVPPEAELHVGDCRDFNAMSCHMQGCDLVYHCAATAYDGLSIFAPRLVMDNVVTGSVAVFSAAIACGLERIVFCSSMARYGAGSPPFLEEQGPHPDNPYGIAKVTAEQALANLCRMHGVDYSIAVPHNIIGARQKFDDPYRNVASIMANLMLQDRSPVIYGDGRQVRCFSHVDDCVACLVEIGMSERSVGEVINIGPDENPISINELFRELKDMTGFEGQATYFPGRPGETKYAVCSSDKARRLLGYTTTKGVDDGLRDVVSYIRRVGTRKFRYHLDIEINTASTPAPWRNRVF